VYPIIESIFLHSTIDSNKI